MEYEEEVEDDPQEILQNLENQVEELKDHEMDLIIKKETPMQILNLILQQQDQNLLEGQFTEEDDYANWIKCSTISEPTQVHQKSNKTTTKLCLLCLQYQD